MNSFTKTSMQQEEVLEKGNGGTTSDFVLEASELDAQGIGAVEEGDEVIDVGADPRQGVGGAVRLPTRRLERGGRAQRSRLGMLGLAVGNVGAGHRRSSGARLRRLEPGLKMPKSVAREERERDLGVM